MGTVRCWCRTNLDDHSREEWPTEMVALPRIGDRVIAKSGRSLYVCGVAHCQHGGRAMIEVELHVHSKVPR